MRTLAMLGALAITACGQSDGGDPDATPGVDGSGDIDAAAACPDPTSAIIGRCADSSSEPCVGAAIAGNHFEAITTGGTAPLVVGFQGSVMMPMAVRVAGINPDGGGDPAKNPSIVASIVDGGGLTVATYQNTVAFTEVAGDPGVFEMLNIFLIFNGDPSPLAGQPVEVTVDVVDTDGERRCGTLEAVAGPLP